MPPAHRHLLACTLALTIAGVAPSIQPPCSRRTERSEVRRTASRTRPPIPETQPSRTAPTPELAARQTVNAQDRAEITAGVTNLVVPGGLPGTFSITGPQSFVVLTGQSGTTLAPLAAATRIGQGRAVALGHEAFFTAENLRQPGNARLLSNLLGWLSQKGTQPIRVGLCGYNGMKAKLEADGDQVRILKPSDLETSIDRLDVICMTQAELDGELRAQQEVREFIKSGHGLLIAGPEWGWQSVNPGKNPLTDLTGNRLLADFGICFTEGGLGEPYNAEGADDPLLNAENALNAIKAGPKNPKDAATATSTLERALEMESPGSRAIEDQLQKLTAAAGSDLVPTASHPIRESMTLARLAARMYWNQLKKLPPEQVKPYPGANDFPGTIPTSAPRTNRIVAVDMAIPGWHGAGMYAAPGEVFTISIPPGAATVGMHVRIASQTDDLWGNDEWHRFPEISLDRPLNHEQNRFATPFGGTIFIDVPNQAPTGVIQVKIENAVAAPHYVRGQTDETTWREREKDAPAPWAEMEGKRVILSVPSTAIRNLKDPAALMAYWDQMMDLIYGFYAAPIRIRPERYCVDRQISAGYMHSGYPIMTFEDVANTFCDVATLRSKGAPTWGFYHEMGHNFQQSAWTFDGAGEVTNNLFSLYGCEKLNGATTATYSPAQRSMEPADQRQRLIKYLAGGAKWSNWENDPFLALTMYAELREAFGWTPFTKVFAEYQTLKPNQEPKTDEEKHDEWMIRFSRVVGKNLAPFFTAWGMPTSAAARAANAQLPTWMPPDWPTPK